MRRRKATTVRGGSSQDGRRDDLLGRRIGTEAKPHRPTLRERERQPRLQRETFRTSRLLDFASEKELIAQTGHRPAQWPLVVLKELVDNAIDACEEADIAPSIVITADRTGITVADNGPGIPAETVRSVLDFMVRFRVVRLTSPRHVARRAMP